MKQEILKWVIANTLLNGSNAKTIAQIVTGISAVGVRSATKQSVFMMLLQLESEGQVKNWGSDGDDKMTASTWAQTTAD